MLFAQPARVNSAEPALVPSAVPALVISALPVPVLSAQPALVLSTPPALVLCGDFNSTPHHQPGFLPEIQRAQTPPPPAASRAPRSAGAAA